MAQIIGLKEKQTALKDIQQALKSLETINSFIEAENVAGEYTISFDSHKTILRCPDKEKINELVRAHKKTIVDRIQNSAQKYDIELDENDRQLMGIKQA